MCFVGNRSTGKIDDHGSRPGNTLQTLIRQQRPVALGEALIMLHWARRAASPNTAAMVIKTDQYDQQHQDCELLFLSVLFLRRLAKDTALRP